METSASFKHNYGLQESDGHNEEADDMDQSARKFGESGYSRLNIALTRLFIVQSHRFLTAVTNSTVQRGQLAALPVMPLME
jgi:hypothetical protein